MVKVDKIIALFNELSDLIFADMRKTAMLKMQELIALGKKTVDGLQGYSYIKDELAYLINELSQIPYEQVTAQQLEDLSFRLNIISLAADMDTFRSPQSQAMLDEIKMLKYGFEQALDFFSTFVFLKDEGSIARTMQKHFLDIAYQGNILLFYTRGEISDEKLGAYLAEEQKASFENICERINHFIQFSLSASDKSAYRQIAKMLHAIHMSMQCEANGLCEKGGAIHFLADEFGQLSDSVASYSQD